MTFQPVLQTLKLGNVHGIRARYTPYIIPIGFDRTALWERYCPNRLALEHKYDKIPRDSLLWTFSPNPTAQQVPKAVVRNRLKRRWANAFADELRERGYYTNGRLMSGPKASKGYRPGIWGTVEYQIFGRSGITLAYPELRKLANVLVKDLIQTAKKHSEVPDGPPLYKTKGQLGSVNAGQPQQHLSASRSQQGRCTCTY